MLEVVHREGVVTLVELGADLVDGGALRDGGPVRAVVPRSLAASPVRQKWAASMGCVYMSLGRSPLQLQCWADTI